MKYLVHHFERVERCALRAAELEVLDLEVIDRLAMAVVHGQVAPCRGRRGSISMPSAGSRRTGSTSFELIDMVLYRDGIAPPSNDEY